MTKKKSSKYKVNVQITDEFFVEAQNEEHARRIIAEHYSNDSLNTVERGDTEVYIFTDEDEYVSINVQ